MYFQKYKAERQSDTFLNVISMVSNRNWIWTNWYFTVTGVGKLAVTVTRWCFRVIFTSSWRGINFVNRNHTIVESTRDTYTHWIILTKYLYIHEEAQTDMIQENEIVIKPSNLKSYTINKFLSPTYGTEEHEKIHFLSVIFNSEVISYGMPFQFITLMSCFKPAKCRL